MSSEKNRGFTIIEVTLFLAVSSILAVALLVGMNNTINRQKYKDSVVTLKTYLQSQYTFAANTVSDRDDSINCNNGVLSSNEGSLVGSTDCLVLGRIIKIVDDGSELRAVNIIGSKTRDIKGLGEKDNLIRNYRFINTDTVAGELKSALKVESMYIPWGATVVKPDSQSDKIQYIAMVIIRSPQSGAIYTFIREYNNLNEVNDAAIKDIISSDTNISRETLLCVRPDAGVSFFAQPVQLAVKINRNATNPSSIEIPLEVDKVCG